MRSSSLPSKHLCEQTLRVVRPINPRTSYAKNRFFDNISGIPTIHFRSQGLGNLKKTTATKYSLHLGTCLSLVCGICGCSILVCGYLSVSDIIGFRIVFQGITWIVIRSIELPPPISSSVDYEETTRALMARYCSYIREGRA